MPFKLTGVAAMAAKIRAVSAKFPDEVAKALYFCASQEMTESKRRTPVEFGVLRASGHVQDPVRNGRNISVTLAFGGAAEDYAIHVHENPDAIHPVGQYKFLESVLNESRSSMAARIAARVDLKKMKA